MRLSLSVKFSLITVTMVVLVAGVTSYLMVFRFGASNEQELAGRDRELAKVLAGLRTADGKLDFETLASFVNSSDKVDTGLVYAVEVDAAGGMSQGQINPRLFSAMDPDFEVLMRQGRKPVLQLLAAGKVDRKGKIKQFEMVGVGAGSKLRLGFDQQRIQRLIRVQQQVGMGILGIGLVIGVLVAIVLARRVAKPVRRLAGAMEAVARGDMNQTVKVTSSDELASLAASFNQMTRALRETGRVRGLFALYVSPPVMERILREANPLEMVAEERAVTVLFVAIHDFSLLARQLGPREVIRLINEYLAAIIDAVVDQDGVVCELDGEHLLAVWGAPLDAPEGELAAIRAALAVCAAVEVEGRRQAAAGGEPLLVRCGICSGRTAVGNIGSARRVAYRVLGGAAEIVRHVTAMAQPGEILVSEATFAKVRSAVEARPAAPLLLEDMDEAVPLYRVERIAGGQRSREGTRSRTIPA